MADKPSHIITAQSVHQNSEFIGTVTSEHHDPFDAPQWYVCSYKILTSKIRDHFTQLSADIFFPFRHVKQENPRTGRLEYVDKPAIPGYIFIHAPLSVVRQLVSIGDVHILRRRFASLEEYDTVKSRFISIHGIDAEGRFSDSLYRTIPDSVMHTFRRVVELHAYDVQFFNADCIDVERNDRVEFIDGEFKGLKGYLKSVKGKKGGLVVMPLSSSEQDYTFEDLEDNEIHSKYSAQHRKITSSDRQPIIYFGINARPEQLKVTAFARNNRHARDAVKANTLACDEAMQLYVTGQPIDDRLRERLLGYLARYGDTRLNTDIQEANHKLLLYRICTVLELEHRGLELEQQLHHTILPAFRQRVQSATHRGFQGTDLSYNEFITKMQQAKGARQQRHQSLSQSGS